MSHTARAESFAAQLSVRPDQVVLEPGEQVRVVVTVEAGDAALANVALKPVEVTGLTVGPALPSTWTRIEAKGSRSVVLTLTRGADRGGVGVLPLRLTWTLAPNAGQRDEPAAQMSQGSRVAMVTVNDSPARLLSGIAKLEVKSAIQLIEDRRQGGMGYVVVTNLASHRLEVTGVRCFAPYFLTIRGGPGTPPEASLWIVGALSRWWPNGGGTPEPDKSRVQDTLAAVGSCGSDLELPIVEPGSSRILPFQITASVVEPGKHTVAWEVEMRWWRGGAEQTGALVVDRDFTVGVLGESALLTIFNWPSVLVLPGALMLLTFLTLRQRVWPKKVSNLSSMGKATQQEFWLIAMVLSFLTAMLYPWLTGKLGDSRDFIVVRGLDDIVNLWLGAVSIATLTWALWLFSCWVLKVLGTAIEWIRRRSYPKEHENPLKLLSRLTDYKDLDVDVAELVIGQDTNSVLVVFDVGRNGVWTGPEVQVVCKCSEIKQQFQRLLDNKKTKPAHLVQKLRDGKKNGTVTEIRWKGNCRLEKVPQGRELKRLGNTKKLVELVTS